MEENVYKSQSGQWLQEEYVKNSYNSTILKHQIAGLK